MLIYGHEKQVIQLLELGTINAQIHEILKRGYQIVSGVEELKKMEDLQTEILILDTMDMKVLHLLYQKKWKNVFFPVCDEILSVNSPDADQIPAAICPLSKDQLRPSYSLSGKRSRSDL